MARNQRKIIKSVRDGTFEYKSKEPLTNDWAQYDQAQIYEMIYYLGNIRDPACEADERIKKRTRPRKRGPGRPPTDPTDVAKAILLQTYVNSSNRVAEGFLLLFQEKLGIDCRFSYKTIERGYDREPVNKILDEIVVITNESVDPASDPTTPSSQVRITTITTRLIEITPKICREILLKHLV